MAPPMIDMTQQMTSPPPVIQPPQPPNIQVQPDPTRQPSLDPAAASPYTPLALPPVDNGGGLAAALPKQEEPQNLGAVTKGGAVAYMLDKVLRGVVQGHQAAVQQQEDQFNKKIAAQQGLHNIAVKNYFGMLQSGQGVQRDPDGSPVVGADGQVVLNDDGKAALNQVKASIGSLQDSINQRFPPPKKSSRTVTNPSGSQSLIQRITNHKNDPNDALMATLQGAQVAYQQQASQFLNPAYQAKVGQAAGTAADTAAAHGNQAAALVDVSAMQAERASLQNKRSLTPDETARLDHLNDVLDKTTGKQATPRWQLYRLKDGTLSELQLGRDSIPDGAEPTTVGAEKRTQNWVFVNGKPALGDFDRNNRPIPGTFDDTIVPPPKVLAAMNAHKVSTSTGTFVDNNGILQSYGKTTTSGTAIPGGFTLPGGDASLLRRDSGGIGNSGGDTTTGTSAGSTMPGTSGPAGPASLAGPAVAAGATRGATISGSSAGAGASAGVSVSTALHPIGYKGSKAYNDILSQANKVGQDFNTTTQFYKTMTSLAPSAKRGDGTAQNTIMVSYLKAVVGGGGIRVTKQEWDQAQQSATVSQRLLAAFHYDPDSPTGLSINKGTTLAPEQIDSMIQSVHAKNKTIFDQRQSLAQQAAEQVAEDKRQGGLQPSGGRQSQPQTHVFSTSAWKRSNPQGDSAAAEAAAKAQNFTVVP